VILLWTVHRVAFGSSQRRRRKSLPDLTIIVITFKTRGHRLPTLSNGSFDFAYRDSGTAWINPATFEVMRLKAQLHFPTHQLNDIDIEVTCDPVTIAGASYPLPATVLVRQKLPDTSLPLFGVFRAEYRDYRKFGATSEFKAEP
jgi:hypothetical protein